jgi:hypothetical protein
MVSIMWTGRNGLAHPPRGISRKLVSAPVLELVHGLHEADIAFLDQVEELQPAIGVALGNRNDQPQVGLNQFLLRRFGQLVRVGNDQVSAAEFGSRGAIRFFQLLHVLRVATLLTPQFLEAVGPRSRRRDAGQQL